MMKSTLLLTLLLLTLCFLAFLTTNEANQIKNLDELLKSRKSDNPPNGDVWPGLLEDNTEYSAPVYVGPQEGLMEADKIDELPGQPQGVDFDQYGGYVTIDPKTGKALFYYFVESPQNSSTKPLVLWLNGGPGCSSLGFGAMEELGPFRVNSDRKTLFRNDFAWNNAANVIFLESPAGVGFSYSNSSSDYEKTGDKQTAKDSYTFLVNWLERFPQYKGRDFFITGESYAGHYVPQLAYTVLLHNNNNATSHTIINLKGIAIGNAWIDDDTNTLGMYDYFWSHALNSDETNAAINKYCDFAGGNSTDDNKCAEAMGQSGYEMGALDIYNIYAPLCHDSRPKPGATGLVEDFDPCSDLYVETYLNRAEVQAALHAKPTQWSACSGPAFHDSPTTILPTIKQLINSGMSVWIYSGDTDGRVPVTSSRYSINTYKLSIETAWRPWYTNNEVGGYVVAYKGVTFSTVRGAGHIVPSYQPARALTMISIIRSGTTASIFLRHHHNLSKINVYYFL